VTAEILPSAKSSIVAPWEPTRNPRAAPRASGFVFCERKTQMSINACTFQKHLAECAKVAKLPVDQAEAMRLQRLADLRLQIAENEELLYLRSIAAMRRLEPLLCCCFREQQRQFRGNYIPDRTRRARLRLSRSNISANTRHRKAALGVYQLIYPDSLVLQGSRRNSVCGNLPTLANKRTTRGRKRYLLKF
jgi:hypothetical protein